MSTEKSKTHKISSIPDEETREDRLRAVLPDYGKYSFLKVPFLVKLNGLMFVVAITAANTGYDGSLLNGLQTMPDWASYMGKPKGAVLGALNNGLVFGHLIASVCAAQISDYFGRRHSIMIGNLIMLVGVVLQGAAMNYTMFLIARIVLGVGNTIANVSSPTLMSEMSYPTHREVVTAFYNTCWYLGAIIAAWVSLGTMNLDHDWCWRIPSILQGFIPVVQMSTIYFVPESPRWLVSKGRSAEARQNLLKYHANGDEAVGGALVDFEMAEIQAAIEAEQLASKHSYLDFLKTPANRKRLFLLTCVPSFMQLSGNGLVSYYLNLVLNSIGITETRQKLIVNGGLMIYNFGIALTVALVAKRFKRRTLFLTSLSMMLSCYIIWTVLSAINQQRNFEQKSLGQGVLAMIFMYYLSYDIGFNGLPYLYMTEILPFTLRAKGINYQMMVAQFSLIFNGFVNPIAMDAIQWKYYIMYCCILFVELIICYFTFVETAGRTLEEVAEVFGDEAGDIENLRTTVSLSKLSLEHAENSGALDDDDESRD